MTVKDADIRGQDRAYRRGLVLGLTMAEIMVLILFALLLALGAALAAREAIIRARDARIATLESLERQIAGLIRDSGSAVTISDIVQRIERQEKQIAALQKEIDRLKPMEGAAKELQDIIRELKRIEGGDPKPRDVVEKLAQLDKVTKEVAALQKEVERLKPFEASSRALEDVVREIRRTGETNVTPEKIVERLQQAASLAKENDNLRGQVAQLAKQISAIGRGNEFPSCWATPEGKTESIFELLITADGVEVKSRNLPHRAEDKAKLPLAAVQYDTELTQAGFQGQMRPLYQWSVEKRCRFYVIINSAVSSAPIEMVNAVNSFFYPDSRIQYRARP